MTIINNRKEWKSFCDITDTNPRRYPCIAKIAFEDWDILGTNPQYYIKYLPKQFESFKPVDLALSVLKTPGFL